MGHQSPNQTEPIDVGGITLDKANHLLVLSGQKIELRPKTFKVLEVLLSNPDTLVSKKQLMTEVWGSTVISEDCLTQCIMEIRKALRDEKRKVIQTYPKRGYFFEPKALQLNSSVKSIRPQLYLYLIAGFIVVLLIMAAIWHVYNSDSQTKWSPTSDNSIAILPFSGFDNVDLGTLGNRFIEEEVVRLLSEHTELSVVSKNASFKAYRDFSDDYDEISKSLKAAYLLEGKVNFSNRDQPLSVSMIKTDNQYVVWSQSFYGALDEVNLIPFYITNRVIQFFSVSESASSSVSYAPQAIEYYLQGKQLFDLKGKQNLLMAKDKYLKALELEPEYADALAGMSSVYLFFYWDGENKNRELIAMARQYAQEALRIDPKHPIVNVRMADSLFWEQEGRAKYQRNYYEKALIHHPNNALVLGRLAGSYMYESEIDKALSTQKKLVAINPNSFVDRINLAHLYYYLEEYDNALSELLKVIEFNDEQRDEVLMFMTKILLIQGKSQEAREIIFRIKTEKYRSMLEHYVDGKMEEFYFEPASCSTFEELRFCLGLAELYVLYGLDEQVDKLMTALEQEVSGGGVHTTFSLIVELANSPLLKDKNSVKSFVKKLRK